MTFIETTAANGPDDPGPLGLPVHLDRLNNNNCPRCGDRLELFEHVARYICYTCGFKIPATKEARHRITTGRGFFIGLKNYNDETPF